MSLPLRSKSGCDRCRARHVKCDEARPTCTECSRFRFICAWRHVQGQVTDKPEPGNVEMVTLDAASTLKRLPISTMPGLCLQSIQYDTYTSFRSPEQTNRIREFIYIYNKMNDQADNDEHARVENLSDRVNEHELITSAVTCFLAHVLSSRRWDLDECPTRLEALSRYDGAIKMLLERLRVARVADVNFSVLLATTFLGLTDLFCTLEFDAAKTHFLAAIRILQKFQPPVVWPPTHSSLKGRLCHFLVYKLSTFALFTENCSEIMSAIDWCTLMSPQNPMMLCHKPSSSSMIDIIDLLICHTILEMTCFARQEQLATGRKSYSDNKSNKIDQLETQIELSYGEGSNQTATAHYNECRLFIIGMRVLLMTIAEDSLGFALATIQNQVDLAQVMLTSSMLPATLTPASIWPLTVLALAGSNTYDIKFFSSLVTLIHSKYNAADSGRAQAALDSIVSLELTQCNNLHWLSQKDGLQHIGLKQSNMAEP